ncbi:Glycosyl transferase family protein [Taphrina deformans PYCC 5710]|uniref:Glycosyl transferase family protein n=1 Tax=Taphrina deformans (strain PYCC 5710 / ATCC 11124 / CBS 356.35 / IMI 108563 / JCM 9778 / NBRC 8474) TaxID=1097556 RepID=R4XEB2_TAPDE|nr:Glycosyl transferase family protein [Taphrina deformans PYCC 5710]|eukprot:CCG81702.1 Glycosyl transferase family protein [Taphrina deformans PYCC 5710]
MTLLSNEKYLQGALALEYSIRKSNSGYPLVVFHPPDLAPAAINELHKRSVTTKMVDLLLPTTHKEYGPDQRFYDCWSKLLPHGMIEYDRIVELDADMLFMSNADELMELKLPHGSMAATHACVCNPRNFPQYPKDWTADNCAYTKQHDVPETAHEMSHAIDARYGTRILNGGLQVVNPNQKVFNDILDILANATLTETFAFADQSLLSHYFAEKWIALPYVYNALKTMRTAHAPIWRDDKVKIIHYILHDKPWDDPAREGSEFVPNKWWWEINNERLREEKMAEVKTSTDRLIAQNSVIIFSKSYCPHCRAAKQIFSRFGATHEIVELDKVPDGHLIQQYLATKSGVRTVPQIFVRSKFIGGNSDLQRIAAQSNGLQKLLA